MFARPRVHASTRLAALRVADFTFLVGSEAAVAKPVEGGAAITRSLRLTAGEGSHLSDAFSVAAAHVASHVELDPCAAIIMGVRDTSTSLTDYSPEGHAARAELARTTIATLRDAGRHTGAHRVAAQVMERRLVAELDLLERGLRQAQLDFVDAPVQTLQRVFDLVDTSTQDAWRTVESLLHDVPRSLQSYERSLRASVRHREIAARRQIVACAERCDRAQKHFARLVDSYGDGPLRATLIRAGHSAAEAFGRFGHFLRQDLYEVAPAEDARGRERYEAWAKFYLGTSLDLDETYAWACGEFLDIRRQLSDLAGTIMGRRDFGAAVAHLDSDTSGQIAPGDATTRWMAERLERAFDVVSGTHFDIPEPLRRLECRVTDAGGIYYSRPSHDFGRPGRVWFSLPPNVPFLVWRGTTTLFHEGVPGHHLQLGHVVVLGDALDDFRRLACHVPGHAEGWALYAEQLMDEIDGFESDAERFGMLDSQQFRTARVIIDLGMHLQLAIPPGFGFHDGERWTPQLAREFLSDHCANPWTHFVRYEVDRYLGRPGQAISYKVGHYRWLQTRQAREEAEGADFSLRSFHQAALDLGPVDLDTLQEAISSHPSGFTHSPTQSSPTSDVRLDSKGWTGNAEQH